MPTPDAEKLRTRLLGQLRYLPAEAEALRAIIARVPDELLTGHPPGASFSIKEIFGLLVAFDEEVHRPRLEGMMAEDVPAFGGVDEHAYAHDEDWDAMEVGALLARVEEARKILTDAFEVVPADDWTRTARFPTDEGAEERDVYAFAHAICLRDAEHLRHVSQRLYDTMNNVQLVMSNRRSDRIA